MPELADGTATPETIAPSFRHMQIEREGKSPACRLRLEARWEDDGTVEGEVSQELFWVDTLDDDPAEDKCHPVSAADRGLIQLYYTPASRDAAAQIKATTGALAARLLRAIEWSSETEEAVQEATEDLATAFEGESAIAAIGKALQARWLGLHDDVVDTKPRLSLVSRRFEDVVNKIAVIFEQGPDGQERGLDSLSDGQQSLFYFALAAAVFDLDRYIKPAIWLDRSREPIAIVFCHLWAEYQENPVGFTPAKHRQLRSYMSELGLTDERNRISQSLADDEDDLFS